MIATNFQLNFLSFILAFCSLTYELVFAQVLSVCVGGTKFQYILTISIFTFALGTGSLIFGLVKEKIKPKKLLIMTEYFLTFLGTTGPFIITWLLKVENGPNYLTSIAKFLSYFFIFLIGLLSGFELPCLFSLSEDNKGKILAFDYLGMLGASLFFPLIGLPELGTAATAIFAVCLNIVAIALLVQPRSKNIQKILILSSFLLILPLFMFKEKLNSLLTAVYLIGIQ